MLDKISSVLQHDGNQRSRGEKKGAWDTLLGV